MIKPSLLAVNWMPEYSRIVLEEYCQKIIGAKKKRLKRLVEGIFLQ